MPLITLCGFPCVGKTRFAHKLASYLEENELHLKCVIVNEEKLHMNKPEHFATSALEKILRQNLKSAVEHALNPETVVILDSCNYIKGFRYELYCMARSLRTPHCVVHVISKNCTAEKWNEDNIDCTYNQALLEELRCRFEAPNANNRWDNPLFHVNMSQNVDDSSNPSDTPEVRKENGADILTNVSSDILDCETPQTIDKSDNVKTVFSSWKSHKKVRNDLIGESSSLKKSTPSSSSSRQENETSLNHSVYFSGSQVLDTEFLADDGPDTVIPQICAYFETVGAPQPNAATNIIKHSSADLLYQLDKTSQSISQKIMLHQQRNQVGVPLVFREYKSFALVIPRYVPLAELQRHRRQFVKVTSQHPPENSEDLAEIFLNFLFKQF